MANVSSSNSQGELVPKLRFPEFEGEPYHSETVGTLFDHASRRNSGGSNGNVITNSAEHGLIPQRDFFDKDIAVEGNTSNYYVIKKGDFVYNPRKSSSAPYGPFNCYRLEDEGIVSPLYTCLTPKHEEYTEFLLWYFKSPAWYSYIYHNGAQGGARHDRVGMTNELMDGIPVNLPCLQEQEKISIFLSALDRRIDAQRKLVDALKSYKRGVLSVLFPQDGDTVPCSRFGGFDRPWTLYKFSDFTWASGTRNKDNLDLEPYAITNEHGFIRQSEAHEEFGYMKDTDRRAYNIVKPHSFAYNPARINVGSIGYYDGSENVIVSSLYEVFQTTDFVDDRFLWHWFKSDEFPKWIEKLQEGSVRLYFYYDKLCECQILLPSVVEQRRIANYLDSIDMLIESNQRVFKSMLSVRRSLLQQMFI